MREVGFEEFRRIYFERGGGAATGWTEAAFQRFVAKEGRPSMRYLAEEPPSPAHARMMVVTDFARREHRLFFLTEEAEERHFGPDRGE